MAHLQHPMIEDITVNSSRLYTARALKECKVIMDLWMDIDVIN